MYEVHGEDRAMPLAGIPQSAVGAPLPTILSDEHAVVIAYLIENTPEDWDGTSIRVVGPDTENETVALVRFRRHKALYFGPPNDEAIAGHPLARRGLRPYGAFVVAPSSWVRSLERTNSVHPNHAAKEFDELRHFVLTFHDSTFECVARSFEVETRSGSILSAIPRMVEMLAASP